MHKNRGIAEKNFRILLPFVSVIVLMLTIFIYRNAVNGMEKEMRNASMNQIRQIDNNFSMLVEQVNRIASVICVDDDVRTFWSIENPGRLDEDFYIELKSKLKRNAYSMNHVISSIVAYAPQYERIMDENMDSAASIQKTEKYEAYNVQWIHRLEPLDGKVTVTQQMVRAVNDNYPYVLTLIKQCVCGNSVGVLAIDIDLKKLYSAIMPEHVNNLSVWVLDADGRIIVQKNKKQLYVDRSEYMELDFFDSSQKEKTEIWKNKNQTVVYSQIYNEYTGCYIVNSSVQSDFDEQMNTVLQEAVLMGIGSICIAGILIYIFVRITNKPWENILSFLKNPGDYEHDLTQSEKETQMIVDYVISSLQLNTELKKELENRVELLSATKLQALKAQMNPHFLFNTLNAIVMMIDMEVEDSQAAQLTKYLSDILHYSLSNDDLVSLSDELEYAEKYAYILENRYQGRFKTEFCIDPQLSEAKVPKLLLQPLLENAVFHGITAKMFPEAGELKVTGKTEWFCFDDEKVLSVHIDIIDNGIGMSEETIDKVMRSIRDERITMEHIGISNVAKRLELLFPLQNRLIIDSQIGERTKVSLIFPLVESEMERNPS